jgi:hypothetical protein
MRADIETYCAMTDTDPTQIATARAWVGEADGRLVAIGGVAFGKGRWFGFIDVLPEGLAYGFTIARAARRFLDAERARGVRYIYARINPHEVGAPAFLTWLGFHLDPRSQALRRWSAAP